MQSTLYFSALSDETRLRCFRLISAADTPLSTPEIVDILKKPLYTISRAMTELKKSGLVQEFKQGRIVLHSPVKEPGILELAKWILRYCVCESHPENQNFDGSSIPGQDECDYDLERLKWRLKLRKEDKVVITYGNEDLGDKKKILFVCVHNSARSQFAEEYLRLLGGEFYQVESAGLTPGILNPYVVRVLKEEGIDIAGKPTVAVKDLYRQGKTYDWVITVCSREAEKDCPVFPGPVRRLNWPFEDPSSYLGTEDEIVLKVQTLSQEIKTKVQEFLREQSKWKGVKN